MSTGKCHRGVTWSCDSWWNPAILLDLSMLCWSDYNSCLKSLVSSKTNFFVIVQRGISKTSLKQLDVVLLSTSDSVKLYQFTTQVAPPFGEQYLQEGFWQLTEYLVADQEILRKTPTWVYPLCSTLCVNVPRSSQLQMNAYAITMTNMGSSLTATGAWW